MPVATWPSGLPQSPLINGFAEARGGNALRSEMEVGPAKTRRRGTTAAKPMQIPLIVTRAQSVVLDTFHDDDLTEGALPFLYPKPRRAPGGAGGSGWFSGGWFGGTWFGGGWFGGSGIGTEMLLLRFTDAYQWTALGNGLYSTSLPVEVLP